jgi:hypothetical protein
MALLAHSFSVVLIVPAAEPQIAQDMERAFLLAADERDQHPDNHADGHLGGLDVYLTAMDASDLDAVVGSGAEIVVDPLFSPFVIYQGESQLWVFGDDIDVLDREQVLGASADPRLPPFAARFEAATGRPPPSEAEAAYLMARLIDVIVRPLDDASDALALRSAIDALR